MKKFEFQEIIIDDLLIEILLRLPIKSLVRFKIVSKHWHSLIANPEFCRCRNSKHKSAVGLFLPPPQHSLPQYIPFSPKTSSTVKPLITIRGFTNDEIAIMQSCNGLFLCWSYFGKQRYYVYNPTTNRYSTLPEIHQASTNLFGMSLTFDPAKSPHYKLVCFSDLVSSSGNYQYKIHVYSSKSGAWRTSASPFTVRYTIFEANGVYWNGAIHWIGYPYEDAYSLYFDFDHDMLKKIPNPPTHKTHDYYFGESCDHLHYVQIPRSETNFNVYEMKRDCFEWFVKYHVDLSLVVDAAANPGMTRAYRDRTFFIFCMVRGEDEANSFLVLQTAGKAVRYNLVSKTFEKLCDILQGVEVGSVRYYDGAGCQYIESLYCI